jgi:hypothetical protein
MEHDGFPISRAGAYIVPTHGERAYIEDRQLKPWFITFGMSFPDGCVCIWATDEGDARQYMRDLFGDKWYTSYSLERILDYLTRSPLRLVAEYVAG